MLKNLSCLYALAVAGVLASLGGCANDPISLAEKESGATVSSGEVKSIAEESFVYGLPIVMNYGVMYEGFIDKSSSQYKTDFNQIHNEARVFTYQDTAVVTPNSDTPYSFLWADLRSGPLVISVPAVEKKRYFSVQFCDGNTFNYGYIGSRTTGNDAGDYLLAGPDWNGATPAGIKKVFHSTTQFSLVLFRTQLLSAEDMANVVAIQSGYHVQPLSGYLHQTAPSAPPAIDFPKIDKDLVKTHFFEYLSFAMQFAPAGPEEKEIRAKLAKIGIVAGQKFDFDSLSLSHKLDLAAGMKAGEAKVEAKAGSFGKEINGWRVGAAFGDRDYYKGDWLLRAAAAKAGIYGNDADEAMYPMTRWDAAGQTLDGGKHNYTLTFPAGQFPPVNAFWSVTIYDGKTQLLIQNPINRYLVNAPMLPAMKKNADGSLTLYIQKDSPGTDKESNWLPAPNGPIYLVMRLYWPKTEAPSILPAGEGAWKPPGISVVK